MADFPKLHRIKQDDENMEKLHCAARKGQTELVRRLLAMGISPVIANRFGCTALHLACKFGQVSAARELAAVSDANLAWHGQKPLHLAVLSNNLDLVNVLVDGAKDQGKSPESILNECDDNEVTEVGDHPKHVLGQTAGHWCVGLGQSHLKMLKRLIELGASPNAKDKGGETLLMRAVEFKNEEALELLLTTNPSALRLDVSDKGGMTMLHWAIRYNNEPLAKRLVQMGADVSLEDSNKNTAMLMALRAAMPHLLESVLEVVDPFAIQSAPCHNGSQVLLDRIEWLPFADSEPLRAEAVKMFQRKLDSIAKAPGANKGKGAAGQPMMQLAPSAPIKKS